MSNNIFKYVNGKFVMTEGYGSVKKLKEEEETSPPSSPAVDSGDTEPVPSSPVSPETEKTETSPTLYPDMPIYHIVQASKETKKEIKNVLPNIEGWLEKKGISVMKTALYDGAEQPGFFEKIKNALGFNKEIEPDEDITKDSVRKAGGLDAPSPPPPTDLDLPDTDPALSPSTTGGPTSTVPPTTPRAAPPMIDMDDDEPKPEGEAKEEQEELQESKYFYPRRKQKMIRHHSLVPYKLR